MLSTRRSGEFDRVSKNQALLKATASKYLVEGRVLEGQHEPLRGM